MLLQKMQDLISSVCVYAKRAPPYKFVVQLVKLQESISDVPELLSATAPPPLFPVSDVVEQLMNTQEVRSRLDVTETAPPLLEVEVHPIN